MTSVKLWGQLLVERYRNNKGGKMTNPNYAAVTGQ